MKYTQCSTVNSVKAWRINLKQVFKPECFQINIPIKDSTMLFLSNLQFNSIHKGMKRMQFFCSYFVVYSK